MTETYYLSPVKPSFVHRFDLTGDHTGVTGVCECGFVFTGVTTVDELFELITEHCDPIAADE
jgi:hypothetical protein